MCHSFEAVKQSMSGANSLFFNDSGKRVGSNDWTGPSFLCSVVVWVLVAAVIKGLLLLRGFYSATFDESGRTLDAYTWYRSGGSLATVWLPLYRLITAGALSVIPDLIIAPRLVSFLFGLLALGAVMKLAEVLFHDRTTTFFSGMIASLFAPRVVLTVSPLAEIMFIALVSLAMCFLVRWFTHRRSLELWLAGIFFALGSSVRYEGWIFAGLFAFGLVLMRRRSSIDRYLSIGVAMGIISVSISFIVFWMILHYVEHGDPFWFISATTNRYVLMHGQRNLLWNNPLPQFIVQNATTMNILGCLALNSYLRRHIPERTAAFLPIVALVLISLVGLIGKGMPTHGFWRIPTLWSLLLVPFTASWFTTNLKAHAKVRGTVTVLLLILLIVLSIKNIYSMTEHSALSKDDIAAGCFIRSQFSQLPEPGAVLIESDIWSYVNVMIASQHPERFILNSGFDPTEHKDPILNPDLPFNAGELQRLNVSLLVFRREDCRDYIEDTVHATLLKEFGPWAIYRYDTPK